MRRRSAWLAVALLGVSLRGAAAELPPWLELGPALGATPDAVPAPALSAERRAELAAQGHGTVELLRRVELRIGRDRIERRVVVARQFLTAAGIEAEGSPALSAQASRERLRLDAAFVDVPGGGRNVLHAGSVQIVSNPSPPIFSDQQNVVIPLPGLQVDAVAVIASTVTLDRTRWPLPWSDWHLVQSHVPIERMDLRVSWDPELPAPAWSATRGILPCARPAPNELICSNVRIAPVAIDPDVPNWPDRIEMIVLAEAHDWRDLSARVAALVDGAAAPGDPRLAEALARARSGGGADTLIERLHRLVADEIRYVALEHGQSAVVPRPAADTLLRRYGDCKDKVTLLLSLARSAGLEAWPVLVATTRYDLGRLKPPALGYFDHMIVCLRRGPREICLDPTVQGSAAGELPEALQGAVALDLRPGIGGPRRLPSTAHAWTIEIEGGYFIECDGSIREKLDRRLGGSQSAGLRSLLRGLSEVERARWVEDDYRRTVSEAATPSLQVDGLSVPGQPVTIRSEFSFPASGSLATMDRYEDLDPWLLSYVRGMKTENRRHPYAMRGMRLRSRLSYAACDSLRIRRPGAELSLTSEYGSLERRYRLQGDLLHVDTELDLPRRTLEPGEIPRFNRFVERALEQTRIRFALDRRAD